MSVLMSGIVDLLTFWSMVRGAVCKLTEREYETFSRYSHYSIDEQSLLLTLDSM